MSMKLLACVVQTDLQEMVLLITGLVDLIWEPLIPTHLSPSPQVSEADRGW